MLYSGKRFSVFWGIIGIFFLLIGFNGLVASRFYTTENQHVKGYITCNDTIKMPDNNMNVVEGYLQLIAIWPNGSKQILIDWHKKARYMKIDYKNGKIDLANIEFIECYTDTSSEFDKIKVSSVGNKTDVTYCNYHFTLIGRSAKGNPKFKLVRKYLPINEEVVLKNINNNDSGVTKVAKIVPSIIEKKRKPKLTLENKICIGIIIVGIAMFFIPESNSLSKKHLSWIKGIKKNISKE